MPEIFISSCSRRELARRRPTRGPAPAPLLMAMVVFALVLAGLFLARGGL
ncbi:MAG: hypothetical protein JO206_00385 [Solirubrobacterales bacterium]|nr:hypothetical protein [Solirubrobacterales bacterium]MBV9471391.1 hypothetical protein [Solirubrobacterales bacterium]